MLIEAVPGRPSEQSGGRAAFPSRSSSDRPRRGTLEPESRVDRFLKRRVEYVPGDWSRMSDEVRFVRGRPNSSGSRRRTKRLSFAG